MAKLSVGPAGREILNLEIGAGNNNQPPQTITARGKAVPVTGPTVEPTDAEVTAANAGVNTKGQNGGGQTTTTGTKIAPNQTILDAGPKQQNGGQAQGPVIPERKTRPPGTIESYDVDWPILTLPFADDLNPFDNDKADETRRSDEARDRQFQESHSANQANVRRGLIRDYLRQNLQDTLIETRGGANGPLDLQRLTQTIADRLSRTHNDPSLLTGRNLNLISQEISHLLVRDLRPLIGTPLVVPHDRAMQLASMLLARLAGESPAGFAHLTEQQLLDGLLFLQLCCLPADKIKDIREITTHKPSILPQGIPWSMFRDTGLLAANLLREGAALRNTAYLDAAVQKFFKLLVANNELGVLLAAVRLTADARAGRVPSGSVAALVRIYELIAQLMVLSERAMKEAAEAATRKPAELKRTDKNLAFAAAMEPSESETALRQFLAFNPSAQADSGASAFFSDQVAETSARIAVDSSQREIVEWLSSGRHRFVTEVDLGKPVGIVIDRATDECFTASWIRVVLVRDGSVLGWHILRSSLVG